MKNDAVIITADKRQAEIFLQAMRLEACGFFEIRGGSATVHFDQTGKIRKVERHDTLLND
jgi:hypothetical protein